MDANTRQRAVGALPVDFVRSPDRAGLDGGGRYLVAINSGFGIQFSAATNRAQQSLAVIDLNAKPTPVVIQNVYFPTPQSANVGLVFAPQAEADGSYTLYVSGGFENKIWIFHLHPGARAPLTPVSPGPNTEVKSPFLDVSGFASVAPSQRSNNNQSPVYPTGLAISADGDTLFVANNLDDSLGIISNLRGARKLTRTDLRRAGHEDFIYPYGVAALPARDSSTTAKVYVSCWNNASIAVIDPRSPERPVSYIPVGNHPTMMIFNESHTRLYAVNSNADSVSVIDTIRDREVERINVRLTEEALMGASPESLAFSTDGATLYVANAHSNALAVVALSPLSRGESSSRRQTDEERGGRSRQDEKGVVDSRRNNSGQTPERSKVRGFIPTGQYPSAVAVAGKMIFIGNGKGTGFDNSSLVANTSGRASNVPNDRFPAGTGRAGGQGGEYSVALISGNISVVKEPNERELARYTQQVMRNDGLVDRAPAKLFHGSSPIKHVIYIIKENRTYDQVFGDIKRAGDGTPADGDKALAIFGAGEAARLPAGPSQNITPNHHALALRFGLLDHFFTNAEASPNRHNWSTAAYSTDYVEKAYRWHYAGRGRTYDFEGFNRLPSYGAVKDAPPLFAGPVGANEISNFMRRFIPYLNGSRDVSEPDTLYLWDAVARAGLTYRNYGEFVGTVSESDVAAVNANRRKPYPDISQTGSALPTKKSLEGHHSMTYRNFDLDTPDAFTVDSYRAAKESGGKIDPTITRENGNQRFRGNSRLGEWLEEFRGYVADLEAGRPDRLPNFSMLRLPNDHTDGIVSGAPTPQFYVADNDYAVGRLVEAVSHSPYWKDTAIFIVEDDAQDGPDHVDCHRSVALVISAYNRPGAIVHTFHNTVSLIRTMELLLNIGPLNQLDASATPINIFRDEADLQPYTAALPDVALNNLINRPARDAATAYWMRRTAEQDLAHADMADPGVLNKIIWLSVRGGSAPMPMPVRLPISDAMRVGTSDDGEEVVSIHHRD